MNKKNASATVYMIFFLVIFLAFSAFAVDGTIVLTNRVKLQGATEAAALAAASQFNYDITLDLSKTADNAKMVAKIKQTAEDTFNMMKGDVLTTATIGVEVSTASKQVRLTTKYISQPFFLAFLGVSGINLEAKACAKYEQLPVTANYSSINWISKGAAYRSDIISKSLNMNDTAILKPLGNFPSASYASVENAVNFGALNSAGAVSLGPGGFITIKLPAPIIDKPGYDIYVQEAGDAVEGYMVFAGLDKNPNNPYVQSDNVGEGISWVNISSTFKQKIADSNGNDFSVSASTDGLGIQDKVYGSGYFDIGLKGLAMAKYIRIVDDNSECGFVTSDKTSATTKPFYSVNFYGEASTATAGADIDSVTVLNHVRLMAPKSFSP